jgi:hypothetical protein
MTDRNREIMRDAFRLLEAFEDVPCDYGLEYWERLGKAASDMYNKWHGDHVAKNLAIGIMDALTDVWHSKPKVDVMEQISLFDT